MCNGLLHNSHLDMGGLVFPNQRYHLTFLARFERFMSIPRYPFIIIVHRMK